MRICKLEDLCLDIIDCPHITPEWKTSGIPVIRNFNLKNGQLDLTDAYYVDEETYLKRIARAKPEAGDIIISREAPMGVVAIIPENFECCLGQRLVLLKVDKSKCNPYFLLYLLMSDFVQTQFKRANSTGSIVSNLCIPDLKNIKIPFVENNQDHIVNLLKSLDDKILNNKRINNNLLQVATTLFDYSFAKRNPNGTLGEIIEEKAKSTIQVGDTEGVSGDYPFFTSGETINEWQEYLVDGINCFLSTGGNASIKVYDGKASYSTDTWCIAGKGKYSAYLYFYLKSIIKSINTSFFAGSGLKHLQKEALLSVNLYIPTIDEIDNFNKVVEPILNKISHIYIENKKLIKQRDFLLPLLMNGQATIED